MLPSSVPAPDTIPERLETGTQNHEGIVGAAAAVEFLSGLVKEENQAVSGPGEPHPGLHAPAAAGDRFRRPAQTRLRVAGTALERVGTRSRRPRVRSAPSALRTPTISLVVAELPAREVAIRLARRGIFASHGNFYAQTVAERLGQDGDGLVRLGCACYTTENEVDRAVESLRAIAQGQD